MTNAFIESKQMNKNTRRAKKGSPKDGVPALTNNPEITIGCGERRTIGSRRADPIFKGKACNTARPSWKNSWKGAKAMEKFMGQGKSSE